MRKFYIFGLIGLACVIIGLAFAEQLNFTTYYPAPYGIYNDMVVLNNLGVGTTEPQAVLDVDSTTSGFLPPRMIQTERDNIVTPPEGSIVYNTLGTDKGLNYYNGSEWKTIGTGNAAEVTEEIDPAAPSRAEAVGFWCGAASGCDPGENIFDLGSHTFCTLGGITGPGGLNTSCLVYFESATSTWKLSVFDADDSSQTHHCFPTCIDIDGVNVTFTTF